MRIIPIFLIIFTSIFFGDYCHSQIKYDIAYQKDTLICVVNFEKKQELQFNGFFPALSPNGHYLAYTVSKDTLISSSQDFARFIVIVDLDSKKISKLNVPNNNYYEPSWSPDCKYISFNVLDSINWQVGLINLENSGFRIIKTDSFYGLSGATWTSDSKNIIASSSNLFKFDLKGNIVDTIELRKKVSNKCDCIVNSKNLYTVNSNYLIFDCGMPEGMRNVDGPVIALFAFNLKTNELNRLTPKGMYVQDFDLGRDNKIIFTGSKEKDKYSNIYQVDLTSRKIEMLIKNGSKPTMSRR